MKHINTIVFYMGEREKDNTILEISKPMNKENAANGIRFGWWWNEDEYLDTCNSLTVCIFKIKDKIK